ncbi:MAG: S-layer homology domain-containing protein [Oscillospiraceae bacterium]|nr:S-layer homology domain-containing protein [Oscillospiraceae bacterium]
MKHFLQKPLSLLMALSLAAALTVPAAASDALGNDLTSRDTLLNEKTQLSTNVFWSSSSSDLRTENLITYMPNKAVTPIVTFGDVLTDKSKVSTMAKQLEEQGYRVVAGINGDFYNVGTGLPIGIVVTDGLLRSSDAGYYAVGFRKDGSAVLGKPGVKVTADLGYKDAASGIRITRQLAGVNKARVSAGGIYLYTYEFNDRHTTGNTESGIDVICSVEDGQLAIGDTLTLRVEQVVEAAAATAIREGQVVLSVNLKSDAYHVNALRYVPVGAEINVDVTAASDEWNDVDYAVGALYSLVENGAAVSGLQAGAAPRTAVGQRADGSLVFYTIDGRKPGHSIGASMSQVAARLIELGCETALCLDGGGSTTLSITEPDELAAKTVNKPSEGSERAVTNHIFLVADNEPSGRLSHFYVSADYDYVLAGSKVNISAAAVDTNFIPMEKRYDLWASDGELDGNVLTTPSRGGDITVTAESGSKHGETTVHAIKTPDSVSIRNSSGTVLKELTVSPGSTTALTAAAVYSHLPLKADPEAFTWTVEGNIGTIDQQGRFTAATPGTGTITVSAGGQSATVNVTVSKMALKTVEDFESGNTIFNALGYGANFERVNGSEYVRLGRGAGKMSYTLNLYNDTGTGYVSEMRFKNPVSVSPYSLLNFWVYGDNSGNTLSLLYSDGTKSGLKAQVATLDFSGWKQVSVNLNSVQELEGLAVDCEADISLNTDGRYGAIYLDQMVLSYNGVVDNAVPTVTMTPSGTFLTATISDAVDGVLPKSAVSVTWDGREQDFTYNTATGVLSTPVISDGRPHRVTITAKDASGNIGRASYDVPVAEDYQPAFTDTVGYWGANYVEFLYTSGVTTGYADGTFRPDQNITRAQFSVMLYRCLGLDESRYAGVELPFADLDKIADYAVPAIKALYSEGVINGSKGKDGQIYFNPNAPLTRAQASAMIGRTQEKGYATVELTFTDAGKIPAYATFYIQTMAAQGILGGYADGSFKPNNNITRGQMAKILYNLM